MKILLTVCSFLISLSVSANALKQHSSPYLAMHGNDPVDWIEWNRDALTRAREQNRLLFISIGYFACHWCHVMQQESFTDKDIAKQINSDFIPVKVDRELNPVLDKQLIEFVQMTNGTAGWPLNVFVTPDGFPLVGATYLPNEHFKQVLTQLADKWKNEQSILRNQAKEMHQKVTGLLTPQEITAADKSLDELASDFVQEAMQQADTLSGGFGQQQKFPMLPQLLALLHLNGMKPDKPVDAFLHLTLQQIAEQGLHDAIGGGFYRYTVDPGWEIPHFEKMLYTNAMMPILFLDAAQQAKTDSSRAASAKKYQEIAHETLDFLLDSMQGEQGAFIASLSAVDVKNIEGGFYLWTQEELAGILNKRELAFANRLWNLERPNELDSGNLPRRSIDEQALADEFKLSPEATRQLTKTIRKKLKVYRDKKRDLPRDTKQLAGMNGLALSALSRGISLDDKYRKPARRLANFLGGLWKGDTENAYLRKSAANNEPGNLFDYAAVTHGLLQWAETGKDDKARRTGMAILKTAWRKFYVDTFWVENTDSLLPNPLKQKHLPDDALISAETLLLEASFLSADEKLIENARSVLKQVTRSLASDPFSYASFLALSQKYRP